MGESVSHFILRLLLACAWTLSVHEVRIIWQCVGMLMWMQITGSVCMGLRVHDDSYAAFMCLYETIRFPHHPHCASCRLMTTLKQPSARKDRITDVLNECLWYNLETSPTCGGCTQLWSWMAWWSRNPRIHSWSCSTCPAHRRTRKAMRTVSLLSWFSQGVIVAYSQS